MTVNVTPVSIRPLPTVRFPLGTHTDDGSKAIWIPNAERPHLMVKGKDGAVFPRIRKAAEDNGYQIIDASWDYLTLKNILTWEVDARNQAIVMYAASKNRSITKLSLTIKELCKEKRPNVHFVVSFGLTIPPNDYIPAHSNLLEMSDRTHGLFCGRPIVID